MADLIPMITESAGSPQTATADGLTVTSQRIPDQIAADRYAKAAANTKFRGMRFSKIIAAGPVSDSQQTRSGTSFDTPGLT